jgi:hypothetical protein
MNDLKSMVAKVEEFNLNQTPLMKAIFKIANSRKKPTKSTKRATGSSDATGKGKGRAYLVCTIDASNPQVQIRDLEEAEDIGSPAIQRNKYSPPHLCQNISSDIPELRELDAHDCAELLSDTADPQQLSGGYPQPVYNTGNHSLSTDNDRVQHIFECEGLNRVNDSIIRSQRVLPDRANTDMNVLRDRIKSAVFDTVKGQLGSELDSVSTISHTISALEANAEYWKDLMIKSIHRRR